jgi:arylsulfatase A-like enzyme
VWSEFEGKATAVVNRWRGERDVPVDDPYLGISPGDRFALSRAAQLQPEITLDRLNRRRDLLAQFDEARRSLDGHREVQTQSRFQQMAFSLMTSEAMRRALDIQQEPATLREQYGMSLFGQATLAARRLIESGSRLVTVFWDEYITGNSAWDTHFDHFSRLKDELLPGLDRAFSALVVDLESRGLLDTTLVACISEHGRTPQITNSRGGGREHWSRAYGGLFAGGGIQRGSLIGRTDKHGGDVVDRPVSPKDILATLYHLLGVDPSTLLYDRLGRPLPLVADGHVVSEMLS